MAGEKTSKQSKPVSGKAHAAAGTATGAGTSKVRLKKRAHPKFNVPNAGFMVSVKHRWRKPRGTHNKKRMHMAFMGALPSIGYGNPASIKGVHPSGLHEILVHNLQELQGLAGKAVRIAAAVGMKKRMLIEAKAEQMGLKILNKKANKNAASKDKEVPKETKVK